MTRRLAQATWMDPNTDLVSGSFAVTASNGGHRREFDRSCSQG